MLPYRTEDGLYLEDDGVLLPWGTSLDPDHPPTGAEVRGRKVFEWKGVVPPADYLATFGRCCFPLKTV